MKGYALSQLPARFTSKPMSEAFTKYVTAKYSKHGYRITDSVVYNPAFTPSYNRSDRYRWIEKVSDGLRFVGNSHDIIRLNHTGWFINDFQDETVHGEVYQLPARNGVPQYVPAVNDPYNENCACVDFTSVTSSKEDAARWADSMAYPWAETEREYQDKERAKNRIEDIQAEVAKEYADFRRIAKELRANCDAIRDVAVVRELVKASWQATKLRIRTLRDEQRELEDGQ